MDSKDPSSAEASASRWPARPAAYALAVVTFALAVAALVLCGFDASRLPGGQIVSYVVVTAIVAVYVGIGTLLATRVPRNPIGWLLCLLGLAVAFSAFSEQYAFRGLVAAPGSLPAARFIASLELVSTPMMLAPIPILLLLFPTGRLPSRRWRPVLWGAFEVILVGVLGRVLERGLLVSGALTNVLDDAHASFTNPYGVFSQHGWFGDVLGLTGIVALVVTVLSVASLFVRRRRASSELRQQVAWLGYVALTFFVMVGVMALHAVIVHGRDDTLGTFLFGLTAAVALLGIPAACAVAVLKYRLYQLDVVVKRTVVFGVFVAAFTAIYAVVVLGIGAAVGRRGNGVLTFAAAAIAAVALQPVRTRAERFADRLVYGRRATPYEVLSDFSERMAGTYSTDDVLPRMARMIVEATGADRAEVWLRLGETLHREAAWPVEAARLADGARIALDRTATGPALTMLDARGARVFAVEHQGDELGALRVFPSPREPLDAAGERLVRDLAAQAGLVLRNVRLIEDLRASRQRIVAAGDQARRRLERNLHDGAQQQLVALRMKLGLVRRLLERDPAKAGELLEQTDEDAAGALEELRDLARGIYPPLLADAGLKAALEAQARKAAVPVSVDADGVGRHPQEVEAAVYFSVLEALQNVAKYAEATSARVALREDDGALTFRVADDGKGFDASTTPMGTGVQGIADRLAALGGDVDIESAPGAGTTVTGRVPLLREVRLSANADSGASD